MKILVVDDSATMRRILVNSLHRIGYSECVEASDGREAVERLDASVQFIITDWNMPNMSGLELTRALRAHPEWKSIPILMVSTRSVKEDIMTAIQAGVNNYIVKPFTPQVLKEKIDAEVSVLWRRPDHERTPAQRTPRHSEATLRLVDSAILEMGELGGDETPTLQQQLRIDLVSPPEEAVGFAGLSDVLVHGYTEIVGVLHSLRQSRNHLERCRKGAASARSTARSLQRHGDRRDRHP